jgi:lipoprotein-anchoring transpeptidase ErfK/SrfK
MRRWLPPLLALALAACSHPTTTPSSASVATVPPTPSPAVHAAAADKPVLAHGGTTVVRADGSRFLLYGRPGPGARRVGALAATNDWQQPLWLPALSGFVDHDGTTWFHVRLPIRPNGTTGWVRGDQVATRVLRQQIVVDLSAHHLRRVDGGHTIDDLTVGVGAPSTPSARGRFFVWARLPTHDPTGPYGVFVLGLSGFSNVITDWAGGGRMAIHGTADPNDRGHDVSHGCVRVYNPQMHELTNVPLGTPVWIHA